VTLAQNGEPYIFQYVPGFLFLKPFPLRDRKLLQGVFIGRDLDKTWLVEQLRSCEEHLVSH
jgi:hypothetical protein